MWVWKRCNKRFSQQLEPQQQVSSVGGWMVCVHNTVRHVWYKPFRCFLVFSPTARQISSHLGALAQYPLPVVLPVSVRLCSMLCWLGVCLFQLNYHVISSTPALPLRPGFSLRWTCQLPLLRTHTCSCSLTWFPEAALSGNVADSCW